MNLKLLKISVLILCLNLPLVLLAQQDPQISMFMVPKIIYNPASAGMNDGICAYLVNRQQWVGYEGRPETYLFGAHGTFVIPKINLRSGGGLSIMSDGLGQMRFFGLKGMYSAHIPVRFIGGEPGHLGIGASVGMLQFSVGNNWRAFDDYYKDPSIPDEGYQLSKMDLDLGIWYKTQKLYFGISSTHLNSSVYSATGSTFFDQFGDKVAVGWKSNFQMKRHYYVTGGYRWAVPGNELFVLLPAILVKTDLVTAQFDVNMGVEWNNFAWGGVSWRYNDAAAVMGGLILRPLPLGTLKFGYSYDVTTSNVRQGSNGSHELFVQYCLQLKQKSPVTRHKSVRFL